MIWMYAAGKIKMRTGICERISFVSGADGSVMDMHGINAICRRQTIYFGNDNASLANFVKGNSAMKLRIFV